MVTIDEAANHFAGLVCNSLERLRQRFSPPHQGEKGCFYSLELRPKTDQP
jgi:hypothetical protein